MEDSTGMQLVPINLELFSHYQQQRERMDKYGFSKIWMLFCLLQLDDHDEDHRLQKQRQILMFNYFQKLRDKTNFCNKQRDLGKGPISPKQIYIFGIIGIDRNSKLSAKVAATVQNTFDGDHTVNYRTWVMRRSNRRYASSTKQNSFTFGEIPGRGKCKGSLCFHFFF